MGGIFGFVSKDKLPGKVLFEGLRRLIYRGYDGAGYAYLDDKGKLIVRKKAGHIERIWRDIGITEISSKVAIAHTRYASRGWPKDNNTHPLQDCKESLAIVVDGIIKDYEVLRDDLIREGHKFASTTDAEVLAHLLEPVSGKEKKIENIIGIGRTVDGVYAFAVLFQGDNRLYVLTHGQPLVIGIGQRGFFISSDIPSLHGFAAEAAVLGDNMAGVISQDEFKVYDILTGGEVKQLIRKRVKYPAGLWDKAGYPHYMLKEIYEIPHALRQTINGLMDKYLRLAAMIIQGAKNAYVIANGTSLHAGLVSLYYFADLAKIDLEVVSAAEFPYYGLEHVGTGTVIIAVSQSGETSDVIRSIKLAKQRGAVVVGVTNMVGSRLTLESNVYLPISAGPEIAVPATKTFTSTIATLLILAAYTGVHTGQIGQGDVRMIYGEIEELSRRLQHELSRIDRDAARIVDAHNNWDNIYVSSSGINYPVALEAALKLKEAAILHSEGIQLGELRHGPMVLVRPGFPVILIKPYEEQALELYDKVVREIKSKNANLLIVSMDDEGENIVRTVPTIKYLAPIANIIPLQLLAYRIGVKLGRPIDTPPGLAKAVTT